MSKRSTFTTITPLPPGISRQAIIDFLHDHREMITLNPLVKEHHPIRPPIHSAPDELRCAWYSLTDFISYLPGKLATGEVTYTSAFNDLPTGLQTHCYAPGGLDIRNKWTVNGCLPGEPVQPVELGLKRAPAVGLYIREDVDMMCNVIMTSFVKKTLKESHSALVQRLKLKAQLTSATATTIRPASHSRACDSIRSISSVETVDTRSSSGSSRHLSAHSIWDTRHSRSGSNSSAASSISPTSTCQLSRNSFNKNKPRNMAVSPPTPPYTPMTSPLWSQLRPAKDTTTTLASLSPSTSPRLLPPAPELNSPLNKPLPQISLMPEPLRIPKVTHSSSHPPQHAEIVSAEHDDNTPREQRRPLPLPKRKFSYDSTSSTENYLMTVTSSSPAKMRKNINFHDEDDVVDDNDNNTWGGGLLLQPAQHIKLLQKHPLLLGGGKRKKNDQQTPRNPNPYEEAHPDYPHMSPYADGNTDDYDDIYDFYGGAGGDGGEAGVLNGKKVGQETEVKKNEQEKEVVRDDGDSGYADYLPPPPPVETTAVTATLNGPFVAAFDEFNICIP